MKLATVLFPALLLVPLAVLQATDRSAQTPNILLIIADDQG